METQISHLCDTGSTREERKRITFIRMGRLYLCAHKALIINICRPQGYHGGPHTICAKSAS